MNQVSYYSNFCEIWFRTEKKQEAVLDLILSTVNVRHELWLCCALKSSLTWCLGLNCVTYWD